MAYTTTAAQFFTGLAPTLSSFKSVGGLIEFDLKGDGGGRWFVDLTQGQVHSESKVKPDAIVRANPRDFMALVEGRMSVADGLLTQRLSVAGEVARLTRLFTLLTAKKAA